MNHKHFNISGDTLAKPSTVWLMQTLSTRLQCSMMECFHLPELFGRIKDIFPIQSWPPDLYLEPPLLQSFCKFSLARVSLRSYQQKPFYGNYLYSFTESFRVYVSFNRHGFFSLFSTLLIESIHTLCHTIKPLTGSVYSSLCFVYICHGYSWHWSFSKNYGNGSSKNVKKKQSV